jgi:hypothetical protein
MTGPVTLSDAVRLDAYPNALDGSRIEMEVPAGLTIAQMLAMAVPDEFARAHMMVFIGGHQINASCFHAIRPKPGVKIEAKLVPQGPALGPLLSIGLSTIAPSVAGWLGVTGLLATNLITAGVTILGGLLINALVKPPDPADTSLKSRPGISGARNQARLFGGIPVVLGRNRVTPDTAAEPYVETEGGDQYLRQVFVVGYGPLEISDVRIGDTPIEDFDDVDIEIREGYNTDNDLRLFPKTPYSTLVNVLLKQVDGWTVRTTEEDIDEIFVDLEWPQGVADFDNDGSVDNWTVKVNIAYRPVSGGAWTDVDDVEVTDYRSRTIRRTRRIKVDNGQYEVRVRRETEDAAPDDKNTRDIVYWSVLRMMRNEDPIQLGKKLARIAVRIRASNQLNGALDQLNCIATSVAPHWNGTAWVQQATRNPAAILRYLAQGPMTKRPRPNGRIDLDALEEWSELCGSNGWNCDAVINDPMTQNDLFNLVAGTGRAAVSRRDGKLSVAIDREITVPSQMFTPRNVMSFALQKTFVKLPDALRVKFISRNAGYKQDELIVYNEGKNKANAQTFETLDMWGKTEPQEAAEFGRYWFWAAKLRPEVAEITTDIEGLVCAKGDMVRLAHDVMMTGLAQGRIIGRTLNGSGDVTAIRLDAVCPMVAGPTYGVRIRRAVSPFELSRGVTTVVGGSQDLVLSSAIASASAPDLGDLVAFGVQGAEVSDWTVKAISPEDDLYARLTLVPHAPEIHDAAAGEIPDYDPVVTVPPEYRRASPPVILNVQTDESALELVGTRLKPTVILTFEAVEGINEPPLRRAVVQTRRNGATIWNDDNVVVEGIGRAVIRSVKAGSFIDYRVAYVSEDERIGRWTTVLNVEVIGATSLPETITGFTATVVDGVVRLAWDLLDAPDIAGYRIRRQEFGATIDWDNAVDVLPLCDGPTADVPQTIGAFLIKGVDRGGRVSAVATATAVSGQDVPVIPDIEGNLIPNGKFKFGDLRHWIETPSWMVVRSRADSGLPASCPTQYCVEMTRAATPLDMEIARIAVDPGDTLALRFFFTFETAPFPIDMFKIAYYDADGAFISRSIMITGAVAAAPLPWFRISGDYADVPESAETAVLEMHLDGTGPMAGLKAYASGIKIYKRREAEDRIRDNTLKTKSIASGAVVRRARQFTSGSTTLTTTPQTIESVTNSTDQDAADEDAKVEFTYELSFTPDATPRRYLVTITLNGPGGFSRSYRINNSPDTTTNASFQSGTLVWIVPGGNALPDTFNVRAEVNINNGTVSIAKTQLVITSHKKPG